MPADRERRTFTERGLCPRLSFLKENEKPYKIKKENRASLSNLGWLTLLNKKNIGGTHQIATKKDENMSTDEYLKT